VFSSPQWEGNHEVITVSNYGSDPINVQAWVNSKDNSVTITVPAGTKVNVSTMSILTQPNDVVNLGYGAYDNGAQIDSYQATIRISVTPTPGTTTRSPGFTGAVALTCVLGAALLVARKVNMKKKER
jgi:PGF-CTERM protein